MGDQKGGSTAFTISANGRLIATAITKKGVILIYDTKSFELVRVFGGVKASYRQLEFSRDNFSQIIAVSDQGFTKSFLLKGKIQTDDIDSMPYFNSKAY